MVARATKRNRMKPALLVAAALSLAGCYECGAVLHDPGVYKGGVDSAAVLSPDAAAREALRARFRAAQAEH